MKLIKTQLPDHFRDSENGAILCTDLNAYINYKMNRNNSFQMLRLQEQVKKLLEKNNK